MSKNNNVKAKTAKTNNSSKNALLHGIFASEIVLPWESRKDFTKLFRAFRKQLHPLGPLQKEVVFEITRLHWLKRRLMRSTQLSFERDPYALELAKTGKKSWNGIKAYLNAQAGDQGTLMGKLDHLGVIISDGIGKAVRKLTKHRKIKSDDVVGLEGQLDLLTNYAREQLLPFIEEMRGIYNEQKAFERAYIPDDLEKLIRYEAMIDACIDKAMSRLVALKEYDKFYGKYPILPLLSDTSKSSGKNSDHANGTRN